jgi:signal transduction histidine kinase
MLRRIAVTEDLARDAMKPVQPVVWLSIRWVKYVLLAFTLTATAAAFVDVIEFGSRTDYGWFHEAIILLAMSAMIGVAETMIRSRPAYRALVVLRFFLIATLLETIRGGQVTVALLLLCPLTFEAALYDETRPAAVMGLAFLLVVDVQHARFFAGAPALSAWSFFLVLNTVCALFAWLGLVAALLHERMVEAQEHIRTLTTTVENLSRANIGFQDHAEAVEGEAAERERQRVTRELHDSIGYTMTNVSAMMNAARVLLRKNPHELDAMLQEVRRMADDSLHETRQILHRLRDIQEPPRLLGLKATADLVQRFRSATGVRVDFHFGNLPWSLGQHLDYVIYRLVQEAITNSFRHGKADRVRISFWRSDEGVKISVWDNGRGVAAEAKEGIGLKGMRERLEEVGGAIGARNVVDGFELSAFIPLQREAISGSH